MKVIVIIKSNLIVNHAFFYLIIISESLNELVKDFKMKFNKLCTSTSLFNQNGSSNNYDILLNV